MKKLLLSSLLALAGLSMSAADYVVYQNGQLGALNAWGWWNASFDFNAANPDGTGSVFTINTSDGGAAGSMGISTEGTDTSTGPLHSSTLNFDWYSTTAGQKIHIRLTGKSEQDYEFLTTADNSGKWNHVSLPVAETFPLVAQNWLEDTNDGAGYIFGITLDNCTTDTKISFNNIIYSGIDEAWVAPQKEELPAPTTVPVPAQPAANVISIYGSAYPAATTFGIGGWGQSTKVTDMQIDGKQVMKIKNFNYLGWEFGQHLDVSSCNMMHVDFFASTADAKFGFTPISPGQELAWIAENIKTGEWNSYDVPLSHWANVDFTDLFQIKFDQGDGNIEGYIANVYFYKDENIKGPEFGGIWYGTAEEQCSRDGKDYNVVFNYAFTANENGTIGIETTIEGAEGLQPEYNVHIVKNGGDEWLKLTREGDLFVTATTLTFTLGEAVPEIQFHLPYAGGLCQTFVRDYVFGAQNQKPVSVPTLRLSASVSDITSSSAVINYNLRASSDFDNTEVKVMLNDIIIVDNPYTLSGLSQNTEYSYTLKAVAQLDGTTYESTPVALNFKTLRDGAAAAIWHGIADGMIKNAYLPGEDESARRDLPVSIEVTLSYNPDQTMTATATFHGDMPVGFVPKVTLRGKYDRQPMTLVEGTTYTATTTGITYEEGENFDYLYFNIAYAGGDTGNEPAIHGYKAGDTNDGAAYGEAASIALSAPKTAMSVGETINLSAIVKDVNGHYLLSEAPTFSVEGSSFSIEGSKLTANGKGIATVKATFGTLSATLEVKCINTADAINLYNDDCTLESDNSSLNLALAFDNNEGTQVEWNCAETQEHYLLVDLGKTRSVQSIELVWEGASATEYTVTLSDDADPAMVAPMAAGDAVSKVFEVTGGQGGAGVTARNMLYNDDLSAIDARYVRLDTKKAFEPGWGIKLKEMRIMGNDNITTVIENIASDTDAPTQYYNLQGMRVLNPAKGSIYIMRRGNKAVKVIL